VSTAALSRAHLEACLVALAIVRPELARTLPARVDRDAVSPACWALLRQLADDAVDLVRTRSAAQQALADRAEAVRVGELLAWPPETLLATVNALPTRPGRVSVLDVGVDAAMAAA
jgi:hypothetical protein